ncbi:MAG: hypothetical protein LBC35_03595 [Coriobacteriales bacterium]|nr:hypothetical protein [Coriobacteriales bacterium]
MPDKLKYSIVMFVAGSCYGIVVPLVRTAYGVGFSTAEVMVTQYLAAAGAMSLMVLLFSRHKMALVDVVKLLGVGVVAAGVSFCYFRALELLPSATALTLLFQFVWMGMVVQTIRERALPRLGAVLAVILVMAGAVLATGLAETDTALGNLDPLGVLFGLLSAAFYTAFLVLSSKVAIQLPAVNRTMVTTIGSLAVAFALSPTYFSRPMIVEIAPLSLALGLIGICLPVFLIALSSPKLPSGLTTVMASSELPSGVVCAVVFLGDALPLSVALGVVVVLVGIVLSELESLRRSSRAARNGP